MFSELQGNSSPWVYNVIKKGSRSIKYVLGQFSGDTYFIIHFNKSAMRSSISYIS